ncbi:MAG: DUF6691 family protein [Rhodothermales bacterium]|nr:DUF6691 family protein [Rhodothermales bacterium]
MQTVDTQAAAGVVETTAKPTREGLLKYFLVGIALGIVFTKSEVISWFRIQEMFRFQAFHMYGVIGAAVVVAVISVFLIKKRHARTFGGAEINIPPKVLGKGYRYWIGGTIFGLGWAMTGACPGPIFALIGNGVLVMVITLLAALVGTWTYSALRPKLPH